MTTEDTFMITGGILYLIFSTIRIIFHKKSQITLDNVDFQERPKYELFFSAILIYEIVTFMLYVLNVNLYPNRLFFHINFPQWLRWVGIGLFFLANVFTLWIHLHLGKNFYATIKVRKDHQLITKGPYKYIRHPMYAALYLIQIGVFLLTANWIIGVTWLTSFTILMYLRVPHEEMALKLKFGIAYDVYSQRTGRFLPKFQRSKLSMKTLDVEEVNL